MRRAAPVLAMVAAWATTLLADDRIDDLFVYSQVAAFVRDGIWPYAELEFEYPPGAILPLAALGGSEAGWALAALVGLLALQLAVRTDRERWWMVGVPLLAGALLRTKFDLVPTVVAVAGLVALLRGTHRVAGVLLGVGVLIKLWPGLLLLARPSRAAFAVAAVVVAVVCAPFVAGGGFPSAMVEFHTERPVQIESTPAVVLLAIGRSQVTGTPERPDRFKSNGLDGGPVEAVRLLTTVLQLLALAGIALLARQRREDPDAVVLAALGLVLAFVALGSVLSPQYLVWLLPLAALCAARGHYVPAALVAAAAVATRVFFPSRYFDLVAQDAAVVALVAVRNLLLLLALAATARALASRPARGTAALRPG